MCRGGFGLLFGSEVFGLGGGQLIVLYDLVWT